MIQYTYPIYTLESECQDCYKCVRECPVKAIKIENGHAQVIRELCILCGRCVQVCPISAKKVRNDINRIRQLIRLKEKVIVSLAPSFVSEFQNVMPEQLICGLKKLGFYGVSETALGAEQVSAAVAALSKNSSQQILISSACPVVVEYIIKHQPQLTQYLTGLYSPLLAHSQLLKSLYGNDIAVVFIGPCIAKKQEADNHPDMVNAATTFRFLKEWLEENDIVLEQLQPDESDVFLPGRANEGALYPVEGGMISGIKANCRITDQNFMSFSGMSQVKDVLTHLDEIAEDKKIFLELLACDGGCINGPMNRNLSGTVLKRIKVIDYAPYHKSHFPRQVKLTITTQFKAQAAQVRNFSEAEIQRALQVVGKYTSKDELNCGACGYNSCREFARALLEKKAEQPMCVSYTKKLAQRKANALIKTMPCGVVIVDHNLKIIECNYHFARFIGEKALYLFDISPGLKGADFKKLCPQYELFETVLTTGKEISHKEIRFDQSILSVSVFTIEQNQIVGGIFEDITEPTIKKNMIVQKSKDVIKKNLETVQKIAYLLGENASETEIILSSIIDGFENESE